MKLTASCARDVCQAARARIAELDITYDSVDELAGFPARFTGKLLAEPPMRGLTVATMFALLGALALDPVIEPNNERLEKLRRRTEWMQTRRAGPQYRIKMHDGVKHEPIVIRLTPQHMAYIGTLGNRSPKRTQAMRRRIARTAARARWAKLAAPAEIGGK
jgi:hypothetical protein